MIITTLKQKKYLRRTLLALLVFLTAMAQNVPWLPGIFGVYALPLLPLTIAIAALDQEVPAILFGAFAGLLWDITGANAPWHAIYLTAWAFLCAMLMRYLLNRNWLTVGLLSVLSSTIYLLLRWLIDYHTHPGDDAVYQTLQQTSWALLRYFLPSLLYTLLLAPICYALVHTIVKRTSRRQRGVLVQG